MSDDHRGAEGGDRRSPEGNRAAAACCLQGLLHGKRTYGEGHKITEPITVPRASLDISPNGSVPKHPVLEIDVAQDVAEQEATPKAIDRDPQEERSALSHTITALKDPLSVLT